MDQEKIDRINTLYHKSKSVGLTEEEKAEQAKLRKEYIEAIRRNMRSSLNNISIQEKDGTITDLGKKYGNVGKLESCRPETHLGHAAGAPGGPGARDE